MEYYFKCQNCGSKDEFTLPEEERSKMGCLLFLFGGFIPALLYASYSRQRVQCSKCGYIFRQPPLPRTPLSVLATWVIGVVLVFLVATTLGIAFPEMASIIPDSPLLSKAEKIISDNPRVFVIGLLPMLLLILVICTGASWVSNYRAHKEMRRHFETRPKRYSEREKQTPTNESTGQ
jgi:rubredoxin